jgi:hypothetical protein
MPDDTASSPVPLPDRDDRRGAERFGAAMPVGVNGAPGTTEDLSASGLSFLSDRAYDRGARIEVVIEYLLDGHNYPLRCEAEVVRSEAAGNGYKIGARLLPRSQLATVPTDSAAGVPSGAGASPPTLRLVE